MPPQFLVDECTYQETIEFLRDLGFDVIRVQDLGLRGASDREVLIKAQQLRCQCAFRVARSVG